MQLISKFNEGFCFLLCIIDVYSKIEWSVPWKDKKIITLYSKCNYKVLDESICKPNKIWPDKGNEFYNRLMKL